MSSEIAQFRDEECLSFEKIAARLGISFPTVRRAYDHAHQDQMLEAAHSGRQPTRGRYIHIAMERRREILRRLDAGERFPDIAAAVGCSVNTVRRLRAARRAESI